MRTNIASSLRDSLASQSLRLVFQPRYNLADTRRLVGAEALVRWRHPQLGEIPPSEFISIAEATNLIVDLDRFVYRRLIALFQDWRSLTCDLLPVSINLSPRSFSEPGFANALVREFDDAGIARSLLQVEITERAFLDVNFTSAKNIQTFKKANIDISLDDFGIGYSSFSYLKRRIASELKIDRSFVSDIGRAVEDEAIIQAIIGIGQSLNLKIVAEGIETLEQLEWLRASGCQFGQGYLLSYPLECESYERLLL